MTIKMKRGGSYETAKTIGQYKVDYEDEDSSDFMRVSILNPSNPCIVLDFDKTSKIAVLSRLYYQPTCTVDGRMSRGDGTRQMLNFAFEHLKELGAEKIQLSDESSITCKGIKVNLMLYFFLTRGETWYERYFKFYPISHMKEYEIMKDNRKHMLDIKTLSTMDCSEFTNDFIKKQIDDIGFRFYKSIVWQKDL